jgi:hypothetical protein
VLIAEALKLARLLERERPRRFAECLIRQRHDVVPISKQQVQVDYCRHCSSLFADGLVLNMPPPHPAGIVLDTAGGSTSVARGHAL